jgi:hypothetical protein
MLSVATLDDIVSFDRLAFKTAKVECYSSLGTPYQRTVRYGMPKIPKEFLNVVVFLYASADDAQAGQSRGGSGFIVSVPSPNPRYSSWYCVTNWHVITRGHGSPVIRINTKDGKTDIFDFDCSEWIFLPEYDIAAIPIDIDTRRHDITACPIDRFLDETTKRNQQIGPGDDVFMIGRFVDQEGIERNNPAVRFGNISLDPSPMTQDNGRITDSYCIDMHSRTGFSGSPVFVFRTPGSSLERAKPAPPRRGSPHYPDMYSQPLHPGPSVFALLGIHWGQFPEEWEVTDHGEVIQGRSRDDLLSGKRYIRGLSGMTCVLPAWRIKEVLDMPKLKDERAASYINERPGFPTVPIAETAEPNEGEAEAAGDRILKRMLNTPPKKR